MSIKRVLITGSSGRIGRSAVKGLVKAGLEVHGFDQKASADISPEHMTVGSIADRAAVSKAMSRVDAVIHLAACPDDPKTPDGKIIYDPQHFPTQLVPSNIIGTYNVLDSAREFQLQRTILASTGQTVDGHLEAERFPVTPEMEYQPLYLYACTKVMLEQMGYVYSQHHGLTVLALRLGWCPRDPDQVRQISQDALSQDIFLSPGDVERFFTACLRTASLPKFSKMFVTSRFTHRLVYSLKEAKELLSWEPKDQWPTGASEP